MYTYFDFLVLFHFQWGPYIWKTYKEVYGEVLQAGSALRGHGFEPVRKNAHRFSNIPALLLECSFTV